MSEFCFDDGYSAWEPDEWDTINANEADDYRHELDDARDGETCQDCDGTGHFAGETEQGEPYLVDCAACGGLGIVPPNDSCPQCHEPYDCCACEHDALVEQIADAIEGSDPKLGMLLTRAQSVGTTLTAEFGLLIEVRLANGKTYRVTVEEEEGTRE